MKEKVYNNKWKKINDAGKISALAKRKGSGILAKEGGINTLNLKL